MKTMLFNTIIKKRHEVKKIMDEIGNKNEMDGGERERGGGGVGIILLLYS